jgi:hypothetical protein
VISTKVVQLNHIDDGVPKARGMERGYTINNTIVQLDEVKDIEKQDRAQKIIPIDVENQGMPLIIKGR